MTLGHGASNVFRPCGELVNLICFSENVTALSIGPELLPIEVLHCGCRKMRVFLAKNSGKC